MYMRLGFLALSPLLVFLLISGCSVDEDSIGRYIEVPPRFEISEFRSSRDWSGMRGPQYFSFTCDSGTFSQIIGLNNLDPIEDFPDELAVEWRALADNLVKTDDVRDWPAKDAIKKSIVYSNLNSILDRPDDKALLRLALHIDGRAYFVTHTLD